MRPFPAHWYADRYTLKSKYAARIIIGVFIGIPIFWNIFEYALKLISN